MRVECLVQDLEQGSKPDLRRVVPISLGLSNGTVSKLRGKNGRAKSFRALLAPRISRSHFSLVAFSRVMYNGLSY